MKTIEKHNWIKHKHIETVIESRVQLGFLRCPKCREWIGFYKDNMCTDGTSRKGVHCNNSVCNFYDTIKLEDWDD